MKNLLIFFSVLIIASCAIFSDPKTAGQFPFYGNYCGADHPKAGTNPQPIDLVDAACKNHDLCYEKQGYFNAFCDNELLAQLKFISPRTEQEKIARKLIISYFKRSPKVDSNLVNF